MGKKTGPQERWKLTPEVLQKLEQAFAIDATIREACYYADISESSYYQLVKDEPVLLEKFTRLREKPVLTARQTVVKNLHDPDIAFKYLERKRKSEFSLRKEVTGADGTPFNIDHAKEAKSRSEKWEDEKES
jgi:hypothetical protein